MGGRENEVSRNGLFGAAGSMYLPRAGKVDRQNSWDRKRHSLLSRQGVLRSRHHVIYPHTVSKKHCLCLSHSSLLT